MATVTDPVAAEPGSYLEPEQSAERPTSVYETVLERAESDDGLYLPHQDITIDPHTYLVQVVDIHFDPAFGTPYWREQHADLRDEHGDDFDIREQVRIDGYDAIRDYLGAADEDALRSSEWQIEDFYPALYVPGDVDESKSSASSGNRKKVMPFGTDVSDTVIDWYDFNLDRWGTGDDNWVICGPYGLYEKHLEGAARERDAHPFFTGVETRRIKSQAASRNPLKKILAGIRMRQTKKAINDDLETQYVGNIASVPRIADSIHDMLASDNTLSTPDDIDTILVSGMQVTEEAVADLEEKYENADVVAMYATSFTGPSFDTPETEDITYYPMEPVVHLDVVDEETGEPVEYGERGQVEINRIGPDFFWPNQRERETAMREPSTEQFDWDGISDIQPIEQ